MSLNNYNMIISLFEISNRKIQLKDNFCNNRHILLRKLIMSLLLNIF